MNDNLNTKKYTTVTFSREILDEIDKIIENNKELGYSGRAEVFREIIREWFIKMKQYELSKLQKLNDKEFINEI